MNHKQSYADEGFITSVPILSPEQTRYYATKYQQFIDTYQDDQRFPEWTYARSELILSWVADLAANPRLLDVVETLIGPDILLWNALLPAKPPHSNKYFGWHQDATYWPVTHKEQIVSAWLALSQVDQEHGGMQMIPQSHLSGLKTHERTFDSASMLRRGQRVSEPISEKLAVNIDLEPGQASFHHTLTLHRSGPNTTKSWRLGVLFNYVSSAVAPLPGYQDAAMPLRGRTEQTSFVRSKPPKEDLDDESLKHYSDILELQAKRYEDVP